MRHNPERLAWLVLVAAFATFCVLVVAVPLGIRWHVHHAEVKDEAAIESLLGTIAVEPLAGTGPVPLTKGSGMLAPEGTVVYVDDTSEALLTFPDQSFMHVYPGSTVRLDQLRSPRYRAGESPVIIYATLLGGRIRIGSAVLPERAGHGGHHSRRQGRACRRWRFPVDVGASGTDVAITAACGRLGSGQQRAGDGARTHHGLARRAPAKWWAWPATWCRTTCARRSTSGWSTTSRARQRQVGGQADAVVDSGVSAVRLWRTGGEATTAKPCSNRRSTPPAERSPRWWCAQPSRCAISSSRAAVILRLSIPDDPPDLSRPV